MAVEGTVPLTVEITDEPTAVYRLYDSADRLLYVGISRNLIARWAQHAADKPWWPQVTRKTVVMYGCRKEAELAEGKAIRSESPLYNLAMGRTEEPRPVRKTPAILRRPPKDAYPDPEPTCFTLSKDFLAKVDAYARENRCDRGSAVGVLLLTGIETYEQEAQLPLEERIAALDARLKWKAEQSSRQPSQCPDLSLRRRVAFAGFRRSLHHA
jgi:predicted GIY-YIG superfamily endonuclease